MGDWSFGLGSDPSKAHSWRKRPTILARDCSTHLTVSSDWFVVAKAHAISSQPKRTYCRSSKRCRHAAEPRATRGGLHESVPVQQRPQAALRFDTRSGDEAHAQCFAIRAASAGAIHVSLH